MTDSTKDHIDGAKDTLTGNVKEVAGKATGDSEMEGEGKFDQLKGDIKEGVADVKDKISDLLDGNKDK
ncbi:MAG TPA: CsbD family protein [Thermomicrobiales bacterium]|nr:CsbD family protein [Thermomicrobiales bacterium]